MALGAGNTLLLGWLSIAAFRQHEPRWGLASALTAMAIASFMILQKRRIDRLKAKLAEEAVKSEATLA